MLHLAALLTGFGGLVLQLAWLRRFGLLLGNTSLATAQVLGVFLLGLGVGGLLVARLPSRRAPLLRASLAYAGVVGFALLGEACLRWVTTLPAGLAQLVLLCIPGVPAMLMGAAFPLLFAGLDRGAGTFATGALNAANLLGAVVGAFVGGNFLLPELGLLRSGQCGGAAYLVAAGLVAWRARHDVGTEVGAVVPPAVVPKLGSAETRLALAAGLLLLGNEVLWLRRLPFFLEGFVPTLSGVVASVLLWSALGAALLPPVLHRLLGARAAPVALVLAVLAGNLGLHESLVPTLSRLTVDSTAGMHLRVLLGASAVVALPCALLGAVVPLLLAPFLHPQTRAPIAGALFGLQGCGELGGAVLVGHVLPMALRHAFFAATPMVLSLAALLLLRRALGNLWTLTSAVVVAALSAFGVSGAGAPWDPRPPARGSRFDRANDYVHLDHAVDASLTASVAYNRRAHSLLLFTDEFRATETGPNTAYMRVLGHLPFVLRAGLERAAVIALGTGATCDAVTSWPELQQIDVVELSSAVVSLADHFTADGPVRDGRAPSFVRDPRARLHVTDGRAYLARSAPASLDVITMEPLLPYAPGTSALYSAEFYALAARALSERGLLLQWVPTHALPRPMFDALLGTFARAFTHTSVWLVDHSTILVGSSLPHAPNLEELTTRYAALSPVLHAALHDVGLASPTDVMVALIAPTLPADETRVLTDDQPFLERLEYWSGVARLSFLPDNLLRLAELLAASEPASSWREARVRRLSGLRHLAQAALPDPGALALPHAVLEFDAARVQAPASVLVYREQQRAMRAFYERELWQQDSPSVALPVAERLLQRDAGSALAWATLAAASQDPAQRARRFDAALALDPLLAFNLPSGLASPQVATTFVSPREDLGRLPENAALAAAVCGEGARAVALRGTFPARAGRSLGALARARILTAEENGALLPLLDPWLWNQLVRDVVARGGDLMREALPLWRRDLSAPDAFLTLMQAVPQVRRALGEQLGGRQDAMARELLARLLVDLDPEVRRAGASALARTAGKRIPYDPDGAESQRADAATALRRLHNPPP